MKINGDITICGENQPHCNTFWRQLNSRKRIQTQKIIEFFIIEAPIFKILNEQKNASGFLVNWGYFSAFYLLNW